ncbi:Pectinesterase PPME1 [Linum grandiflorum]
MGIRDANLRTVVLLLLVAAVCADDTTPIPADKAQVEAWFKQNVKPLADRKATLNATLVAAEANATTIKVRPDGSGQFTTLTDAINSIPSGNTRRVIIDLGSGLYTEKVMIERSRPFITLIGDPNAMPILQFGGTAREFGTVYSATLQVEGDYFVATNVIFKNTAPRPDGTKKGEQALALRIGGHMATFYNCKFHGFQDTLCDDRGWHFFKDCYIEGTVDYIFGSGTSLYLTTELKVLQDGSFVTAQARNDPDTTGYSFVHCDITGAVQKSFLGRAWSKMPKTVFLYCNIGSVICPSGWSDNNKPERDATLDFLEYKNTGPAGAAADRAKFSKQLTDAEAQHYLSLGFIQGSSWLLPPPVYAP